MAAKPKTIQYRCNTCGAAASSKPLPPLPALQVYGLPEGWELVTLSDPDEDDHLKCVSCVGKEAGAPRSGNQGRGRRTGEGC